MGLQPGDPHTGLPLGLRWVSIGHAARKQGVHFRAQASPTRDTSRSTWTTDVLPVNTNQTLETRSCRHMGLNDGTEDVYIRTTNNRAGLATNPASELKCRNIDGALTGRCPCWRAAALH